MRKLFRRWWRSMFPQYILQVTHRGVERRIHVVKFTKKTQKKLAGVNSDGETFELISTEPMDYYIEEYRDDLR
jgi:hypothetical protein